MPIKTITLSKTAGEPTLSVFIGQAQYGEYTVTLRSASGQRQVQAEGDNVDDLSDTFSLKTPLTNLDGTVLSWWITIAAPESTDGQLYFARVEVAQGGKAVPGGAFEYSGTLANTENIVDAARLAVA